MEFTIKKFAHLRIKLINFRHDERAVTNLINENF